MAGRGRSAPLLLGRCISSEKASSPRIPRCAQAASGRTSISQSRLHQRDFSTDARAERSGSEVGFSVLSPSSHPGGPDGRCACAYAYVCVCARVWTDVGDGNECVALLTPTLGQSIRAVLNIPTARPIARKRGRPLSPGAKPVKVNALLFRGTI